MRQARKKRISFYSVLFRLSRGKNSSWRRCPAQTFCDESSRVGFTGLKRPICNSLSCRFLGTSDGDNQLNTGAKVRLLSGGGVAVISFWDESGRVSKTADFYEIRNRSAGLGKNIRRRKDRPLAIGSGSGHCGRDADRSDSRKGRRLGINLQLQRDG